MRSQQATRRLVSVRPAEGRTVIVWSDDGTTKTVDLAPYLTGPVFRPLADDALFADAFVDPQLHTVCWPGELDLAPELFEELPDLG